MRWCEYRYTYRNTQPKNISEFLWHFSSRQFHTLFFGLPCIYHIFKNFALRFFEDPLVFVLQNPDLLTLLVHGGLSNTADTDLQKMVPVEKLLNCGNYFLTLQLGFWKFLSGIVFLHSIWPKPRAFNPTQKSIWTPKFDRANCVECYYYYYYARIIKIIDKGSISSSKLNMHHVQILEIS